MPPSESLYTVTVEWGDCDPAGIVYYPAYYRWMDQATFRMFRAAGLTRDHLVNGQWTEGTPLVETKCAFKRASQHGAPKSPIRICRLTETREFDTIYT